MESINIEAGFVIYLLYASAREFEDLSSSKVCLKIYVYAPKCDIVINLSRLRPPQGCKATPSVVRRFYSKSKII